MSTTPVIEPRVLDAYRQPQQVRSGCTHQLACRCDAPYWLRVSSALEEQRESFLRRPFIFELPQQDNGDGNG